MAQGQEDLPQGDDHPPASQPARAFLRVPPPLVPSVLLLVTHRLEEQQRARAEACCCCGPDQQTNEEISGDVLLPNHNLRRLIHDLLFEGGQGLTYG